MDALRRYPLNALRAAEAAGRLGSLARAAADLGVTVGAVSQHIRHLEAQLGTALFVRSQKGVVPTVTGERLLPELTAGFRLIDAALAGLEGQGGRALVVTVPPVFAAKWLVWRLPTFQATRPGLHVRIDASPDMVDLDTAEADLAIRVGVGPWPRMRAEKLMERTIFPVCSPVLASRLRTVRDLADVPVIRDHGAEALWMTWLAAHDCGDLVLGQGPVFSDSALCLDAAASGQGVMMAWPALALNDLVRGTLVAPFPGCVPTGSAYWLVTSVRKRPSADVRAFSAWIRGELAADAEACGGTDSPACNPCDPPRDLELSSLATGQPGQNA